MVVPLHTMDGTLLTAPPAPDVAPGVPVRLRLINTDDRPHALVLHGTSYRLASVDGRELAGGGPLGADTVLPLPAGGRHDLVFTQPPGPVRLAVDGRDTGVLLGRDDGRPPPVLGGRLLDVTRYAPPGPPPWGPDPRFAVDTTLVLDRTLGFSDGLPALTYPINGAVYPAVPDIVVRRGDLVRMTIVNRERAAPDAPARPPRARCWPATAGPLPVRCGWTRSRSGRVRSGRSRCGPTTPACG